MAIENLFDQASSVMTVVSFVTFIGIVWWTYLLNKETDFAKAAQLPFEDEIEAGTGAGAEKQREHRDAEVHRG